MSEKYRERQIGTMMGISITTIMEVTTMLRLTTVRITMVGILTEPSRTIQRMTIGPTTINKSLNQIRRRSIQEITNGETTLNTITIMRIINSRRIITIIRRLTLGIKILLQTPITTMELLLQESLQVDITYRFPSSFEDFI